jgi:hypothetical protein
VDVFAVPFPFPFCGVARTEGLTFAFVGNSPSGIAEGKKTAAQRSNSRQSKNDFASRYLWVSRASRAVSMGSGFWDITGLIEEGISVLDMGESRSASEVGVRSSGVGREERSSAALERRLEWRWRYAEGLPFRRLVETALRAIYDSVLEVSP